MAGQAQGWYRDPYELHEDRYLSAGVPTKLVRDGGKESYDPPPDAPLPPGALIPVEPQDTDVTDGADLHRADEASQDPPYSARRAITAVWRNYVGRPARFRS